MINNKTDVWSLGVLIYSLMNTDVEQLVWEMNQEELMIMLINKVNPFKNHTVKNAYSEQLNKIVERMIDLNHRNRIDCRSVWLM